jgi:hypothetical protein
MNPKRTRCSKPHCSSPASTTPPPDDLYIIISHNGGDCRTCSNIDEALAYAKDNLIDEPLEIYKKECVVRFVKPEIEVVNV